MGEGSISVTRPDFEKHQSWRWSRYSAAAWPIQRNKKNFIPIKFGNQWTSSQNQRDRCLQQSPQSQDIPTRCWQSNVAERHQELHDRTSLWSHQGQFISGANWSELRWDGRSQIWKIRRRQKASIVHWNRSTETSRSSPVHQQKEFPISLWIWQIKIRSYFRLDWSSNWQCVGTTFNCEHQTRFLWQNERNQWFNYRS